MTELKPCPFCGGNGKMARDVTCGYETFWVFCTKCGSQANYGHFKAEAAAAWNTRAERTCRIEYDEEETERVWDAPEDTWGYRCDACGDTFRYDRGLLPHYCPNCGAKVVDE